MSVRATADGTHRPNLLNDLDITSGSNDIVSLSAYTYSKGQEIYGERAR